MRTTRASEFFLPLDFGLMDLGFFALVPQTLRDVYMILRRFIWRSDDARSTRSHILRNAKATGLLIARVSQSTIAQLIGRSRVTVNKAISELKEMGLITVAEDEVDPDSQRQASLHYILGEMIPGRRGSALESYYLDEATLEAWDEVCAIAEERGLQPLELPVQVRRDTLEKYLSRLRALACDPPLLSELNTPCKVSEHPLLSGLNTRKENRGTDNPRTDNREKTRALDDHSSDDHAVVIEELDEDQEEAVEIRSRASRGTRPSPQSPPPKGLPKGLGRVKLPAKSLHKAQAPARAALAKAKAVSRPEALDSNVDLVSAAVIEGLTTAAAHKKRRKASKTKKAVKGKPRPTYKAKSKHQPILNRLWTQWESLHGVHFPKALLDPWRGKDSWYVQDLVDRFGPDPVADGLTYLVECWPTITERFTKGRSVTPSLSLLHRFAVDLLNEARFYSEHRDAVEAWRVWKDENPDNPYPPEKLQSDYNKALAALKRLGVKS